MINVYCDGACSKNGSEDSKAGIGIVVEWQNANPLIVSKYIGEGKTNNIAEYEALIETLQVIKDLNIKVCTINSDSNLMVNQVNGNWKCKDKKLQRLLIKANNRLQWLKTNGYQIKVKYIPRELNLADNPAKNAIKKEMN